MTSTRFFVFSVARTQRINRKYRCRFRRFEGSKRLVPNPAQCEICGLKPKSYNLDSPFSCSWRAKHLECAQAGGGASFDAERLEDFKRVFFDSGFANAENRSDF
jgi:hypothetical protein